MGECNGVNAAGVWALLMAGGFVVLALLGLAVLAERPRTPRPDLTRLRAEADELTTHAAQAQVEAARAADSAVRARAEVALDEAARDEAWAALEAVEQAYDLAWQAALAGRQAARVDDGGDGAARERAVSRAALSAYRRGDISGPEFREVWRRAGDWDPAQEERERVAERCRIEQTAARRAHDRATAVVRRADQAARVAEVAAQALIDEAAESAAEAAEALLAVNRYATRRRPRRPHPRP
jgi:hypothetical protein